MARTSQPAWHSSPWKAGIVIVLGAWTLLMILVGAVEPEGPDARVITFGVMLALTTATAAFGLFFGSPGVRAVATVSAGTAAVGVGVIAGATVGLPLVPVGFSLVVVGLIAAEGAPMQRRAFMACALAATGVVLVLAAIALAGRGLGA
jgi:hypothetical protein